MATYTIDTAAAIKKLIGSGMPEAQAEAVVHTFAETQDEVATKGDIREIKAELDSLKNYLLFRIVLAQIAGAGLVFALIKLFG